jgi:NitT/TauT family transport system ATP-binding protein
MRIPSEQTICEQDKMNYICKISGLGKTYNNDAKGHSIIDGLDMEIKEGEILSIIAPSGYGKTTLLNILGGIESYDRGRIEWTRDFDTGYMFQREVLLPWRNILNNILLGIEIKGQARETYKPMAKNLLKRFGLEGTEKLYPHQLSGGMHQRVALIQNLIFDPGLILLDEPFSSLDYVVKLQLEIEVYKYIKDRGMTGLLVTHDIEEAITLSDRIILFDQSPLSTYQEFQVIIEDRGDPAKVRRSQVFVDLFSYFWRFFEQMDRM